MEVTGYVRKNTHKKLASGEYGAITLYRNKNSNDMVEVVVQIKEPEKKVEISVSDFDEAVTATAGTYPFCTNVLKEKLFSKSRQEKL